MSAAAAVATKPAANAKRLHPSDIQAREHKCTTFYTVCPANWTREDSLDPSFLGLAVERIQLYDEVHIRDELGRWLTKAVVVARDEVLQTVTLAELPGGWPMNLEKARKKLAGIDLSHAVIEDTGSEQKFRILHGHTVVKSGMATRAEAEKFLKDKAQGLLD